MPEIVGSGARDTLAGTAGADTLFGRDGSDSIAGGAGGDLIYGFGAGDADPDGGGAITAVRVAFGLARPLFAVSPPGDPDRLFIVEQYTGRIIIFDTRTGAVQSQPFLDLPDGTVATGTEQGLCRWLDQHWGISAVQFLTPRGAGRVIGAMRKWQTRKARDAA